MRLTDLDGNITGIQLFVVIARIHNKKLVGQTVRRLEAGKSPYSLVSEITRVCGCNSSYCGTYSFIEDGIFVSEIVYTISTHKSKTEETLPSERLKKIIDYNKSLNGVYFDRIQGKEKHLDLSRFEMLKDVEVDFDSTKQEEVEDTTNKDLALETINKKATELDKYFVVGTKGENEILLKVVKEVDASKEVILSEIFANSEGVAEKTLHFFLKKRHEFFKTQAEQKFNELEKADIGEENV